MNKSRIVKIVKNSVKYSFFGFITIILIGYCIPNRTVMPVQGATNSDYHPDSFWYYPWGKSGTHKGVDIFSREGTNVLSTVDGYVAARGFSSMGGNYLVIAGPKWKMHYYAHLKSFNVTKGDFVFSGDIIGKVGTTGNAKGKPAHLHYSIVSSIPLPWRIDGSVQGWKKMFFVDPIPYINKKAS